MLLKSLTALVPFLEKDNLIKQRKFQWILNECEQFRQSSYYPDFNQFVIGYFYNCISAVTRLSASDLTLNTSDELCDFLEGNLSKEQLLVTARKRKVKMICYSELGTDKFIEDDKFLESFYANPTELNQVKGNVAQTGLVRGTAKIVISKSDFDKFQEGDILVTIQSNPSFMPILIKCAAIVADEGGIMSHASVISRELKKPCVIGTKFATKVFKDGDLIEVDAVKGVVRKLK